MPWLLLWILLFCFVANWLNGLNGSCCQNTNKTHSGNHRESVNNESSVCAQTPEMNEWMNELKVELWYVYWASMPTYDYLVCVYMSMVLVPHRVRCLPLFLNAALTRFSTRSLAGPACGAYVYLPVAAIICYCCLQCAMRMCDVCIGI